MFVNKETPPWISLLGMCLSGALSEGAWKTINRLAQKKFPTPPCGHNNPPGSLSYLVARSCWVDWWLRIIMRTMFDAVAKPITSGIELCRANAPTVLPTDYITEADDTGPTGVSQIPQWQTHRQSDLQEAPRFTRLLLQQRQSCVII